MTSTKRMPFVGAVVGDFGAVGRNHLYRLDVRWLAGKLDSQIQSLVDVQVRAGMVDFVQCHHAGVDVPAEWQVWLDSDRTGGRHHRNRILLDRIPLGNFPYTIDRWQYWTASSKLVESICPIENCFSRAERIELFEVYRNQDLARTKSFSYTYWLAFSSRSVN